jgi:hypothetical protein
MVAGEILPHETSNEKNEQLFVLTDLSYYMGNFFGVCLKIKITFSGLFQSIT